ncbi:MAG: energy-coupling factor transporter transmembrane component T [Candidatus Limnocylindrales bacterium]
MTEPGTAATRLPDYVVRRPAGFYRSANPGTKLAVAAVEVVAAFLLPGWLGPAVVLAAVLATAAIARRLRGLATIGLAASPLIGSILLINLFLLPGASDPIARLGPLAPTWSGLWFGFETTARLLAFSSAVALVYLTTAVDDLLADLSRRGLGRRATFVVGAAVQMVPLTMARAGEILDAQRARGMDTEGRFWRRARGVLPLAAPVVFGALTEVEERSMALEARAFSAPGRQTLLRIPADSPADRALRWAALLALAALIGLRVSGRLG